MKTVIEQVADSIAGLSDKELEKLATVLHRQHEDKAVDLMRNISLADMSVMVGQGSHDFDNWPV